jgi:hypothetical protein
MKGKDGEVHTAEILDAVSLFDAASKAIQQWARLWWFSGDALIEIECVPDRWRVSQDRSVSLCVSDRCQS